MPETPPTPQKDFEALQAKIDASLKEFKETTPTTPPTQGSHTVNVPDGFDVEVVDGKLVFKKQEEPPTGTPAPGTPPVTPPPVDEPKPPEDEDKKKMLELMTEMNATMNKMKMDYEAKLTELETENKTLKAADVPPTTPPPADPATPPPSAPAQTPPPSTPPVQAPADPSASPPGQLEVPGTYNEAGEGRVWNENLGKFEDFSTGYVEHMGAAMLLKFKNAGGSFGGAQPDSI